MGPKSGRRMFVSDLDWKERLLGLTGAPEVRTTEEQVEETP